MVKETLTELSLPFAGHGSKRVRVFVPEHEENEALPLIYMTDGQNLFDFISEHQFGCWKVRETVRAERNSSGKAAVIVGIHNDGHPAQRTNELTPRSIGELFYPPFVTEEMKKMMHPEGEEFACFVLDTVMPAIEAKFPVKNGRENTAFCGSSSGGLEALYIALSYPDKFSASGVLSPAPLDQLYVAEQAEGWLKSAAESASGKPFLYLYSGGTGEMEADICRYTKHACEILSSCYPAGRMKCTIVPENIHHENAWGKVFADFLHMFLSGQCK